MLLQFTFRNFRSFRDEATLDLTSAGISEYPEHVVSAGKEKVLPIAAVYGANASGKSNMQEAFRYMFLYVVDSFSYGGEDDSRHTLRRFRKPTPFLLDNSSKNSVSTFEVLFNDEKGKEYNYGFSIGQEGVAEEWLGIRNKTARGDFTPIFRRSGDTLEMPGLSPKHQENIRIAIQKETLVVSLGAKLKNAKLAAVRNWFLGNDVVDFGTPLENFFLSTQLPDGFVENKETQQDVVRYFSAFDPSIIGFTVSEKQEDEDKTSYRIEAIHKTNDHGSTVTIPLAQESAGTLKMFALYPLLQKVLQTGGVLFVDELNARLHPLLVRALLLLFTSQEKNPNHAQMVFTTHDSWLLNSGCLRRDEIWFVEKDADGASSLYSLVEFCIEDGTKIRKDENFEKNYLLGKYGAIPDMQLFDIPKKEDANA